MAHISLALLHPSVLRRQDSGKKLTQCLSKTKSHNQDAFFSVTQERPLIDASMLWHFGLGAISEDVRLC